MCILCKACVLSRKQALDPWDASVFFFVTSNKHFRKPHDGPFHATGMSRWRVLEWEKGDDVMVVLFVYKFSSKKS